MSGVKKNIVWLTPGFAADDSDTSCIPTLQDLAKTFSVNANFDLTIIAMHYPFSRRDYTWDTIPVIAMGGQNKKDWQRIKLYYSTWMVLRKLHRKRKIDVLHSFWIGDASLVAQYFCRYNKIKHVATIMGQDALGNSYFKWSRFNSMKLVSLTPFAANHFKKVSGMETDIIPFGLPANIALPVQTKTIDLLSAGSIIPLKNHLHFLKLLADLKKKLPHIKALIVGEQHDASYLSALQTFIIQNDLSSNIQVIPKVTREEMLQYMSVTKILIHASNYESQGMVMLEALANGCKVFSSGKGVIVNNQRFEVLPENFENQTELILEELSKDKTYPSFITLKIEDTYASYKNIYLG